MQRQFVYVILFQKKQKKKTSPGFRYNLQNFLPVDLEIPRFVSDSSWKVCVGNAMLSILSMVSVNIQLIE